MKNIKRFFSSLIIASAIVLSTIGINVAYAYPTEPIQLVVPFKPGGGADRTFRLFAPYLSEELGVPVNVVNIAGGGGWVAWAQAVKWDAEKDDHKLSKHDKRIIQPNKNRGNNSPPAGKFRLSKPKNIDKQINDNDVK